MVISNNKAIWNHGASKYGQFCTTYIRLLYFFSTDFLLCLPTYFFECSIEHISIADNNNQNKNNLCNANSLVNIQCKNVQVTKSSHATKTVTISFVSALNLYIQMRTTYIHRYVGTQYGQNNVPNEIKYYLCFFFAFENIKQQIISQSFETQNYQNKKLKCMVRYGISNKN